MIAQEELVRRLTLRADRQAVLHGENYSLVILLRQSVEALTSQPSAVLTWIGAERSYQDEKYGTEMDDKNAEQGLVPGSYWYDDVLNRLHRAYMLGGPETPLGMQAVYKLATTTIALAETFTRTNPDVQVPAPGVPSGEVL